MVDVLIKGEVEYRGLILNLNQNKFLLEFK